MSAIHSDSTLRFAFEQAMQSRSRYNRQQLAIGAVSSVSLSIMLWVGLVAMVIR